MVVPLRLVLVAVVAFMAMAVTANSALMTRARLQPGCTVVHDGNGPALQACHKGWFKGFPNLMGKGCTAVGTSSCSLVRGIRNERVFRLASLLRIRSPRHTLRIPSGTGSE